MLQRHPPGAHIQVEPVSYWGLPYHASCAHPAQQWRRQNVVHADGPVFRFDVGERLGTLLPREGMPSLSRRPFSHYIRHFLKRHSIRSRRIIVMNVTMVVTDMPKSKQMPYFVKVSPEFLGGVGDQLLTPDIKLAIQAAI
jgi:hypothetical protein